MRKTHDADPTPKGVQYIREQTGDGKELADFALKLLRGAIKCKVSDRIDALKWLSDRGFGKAVETQVRVDGTPYQMADGTRWKEQEMQQLVEVARRLIKER